MRHQNIAENKTQNEHRTPKQSANKGNKNSCFIYHKNQTVFYSTNLKLLETHLMPSVVRAP